MNIRVYLSDEVQNTPGFQVRKQQNKDGRQWDEYTLPGISLYRDGGRFYIYDEFVPSLLVSLVKGASLHETFEALPKRKRGIYKYRDATATLDWAQADRNYWIQIRGKSIESIIELYGMIRAGTILPVESWEVGQTRRRIWWFHLKRAA